jgi:hypothetical protein
MIQIQSTTPSATKGFARATRIRGSIQDRSRARRKCRSQSCRLDLNDLPTAVGSISLWVLIVCHKIER